MARRSRSGTSIKRAWDFKRIAQALKTQGIDLRHWVSYATVASVTGEDGKANYKDRNAIVITPAGVEIDVVLEPSGYPCTCKYGIQAGTVYICTPIRPGDQVLVSIPDGDVAMVPVAIKVVSGSSDPMPTEEDGLPVFKNDRALVAAQGVPIELRTMGGISLLVNPDGTIQLGAGAIEKIMLGTTYRDSEGQMNQDLSSALTTLNGAAAPFIPTAGPAEFAALAVATGVAMPTTVALLTAFATFVPLWKQFVDQFEANASAYLSNVSKTK